MSAAGLLRQLDRYVVRPVAHSPGPEFLLLNMDGRAESRDRESGGEEKKEEREGKIYKGGSEVGATPLAKRKCE